MIAYLKGKLAYKDPAMVIIECAGVGYECRISLNTYGKLGKDENIQLHTYHMVREDAQTLFGFIELEEKRLFEQLIAISGVGGNTALTILSSISPTDFHKAVETGNLEALKRVKGIGAKTAGRIILELKGKLKLEDDGSGTGGAMDSRRQESLNALTSLGFPKPAMEKKVDEILAKTPEATLEDIIKLALKG